MRDPNPAQQKPLVERWLRRLQRVSLRTKITAPMVLLSLIPTLLVGVFVTLHMADALRAHLMQGLEFNTQVKVGSIQELLDSVRGDLLFLSQTSTVHALADEGLKTDSSRSEVAIREAEREFLVFSQGKRAYLQVRFLDANGMERVRLNSSLGVPRIVGAEELQNKSGRPYVAETLKLAPGEVHASSMDLNIEHGVVEEPFRPVVRFASPVLGPDDRVRGLVIINLDATFLMGLISDTAPGAEAWLVDRSGLYLGYVGADRGKSEYFHLSAGRRLEDEFSEAEVAALLAGGRTIETRSSIFSSAPIAYGSDQQEADWLLVIANPRAPITAAVRSLTVPVFSGIGIVVAVAALLGALVGGYLSRPVVRLREATRRLARQDLDSRVEVATGDEIEDLANDFNVMAKRLREATDRLASWNQELQGEVEQQTEALRNLQAGMAQADRLACIGQITAGVLHEVGNPLAGIKTLIQVEQEEGEICSHCNHLLINILGEVNRLASFLRSFSRLASLGGQSGFDRVDLPGVVDGVVGLIGAQFRRRELSVSMHVAEGLPQVWGRPDQLRQVVMNLLLNAADASSPESKIEIRIAKEESGNGAQVRLQVLDSGKGLATHQLDRVWDPFFTTKSDGSGLGLGICRQLIEDHGGCISMVSEEGCGTTVSFTLREVNEGTTMHGETDQEVL